MGRWLEDEVQDDGGIKRIHRSDVLGSLKDFPTKRLAQRQLDSRISVVNSLNYRARPTAKFRQLTDKWQTFIMVNHEESTQRGEKSDIKAWVAAIGDIKVSDIDCELLQGTVNDWKCSPKTIKNRVGTFRLIWDKAKLWKYTAETAYEGLELKDWVRPEQPFLTLNEIGQVIALSEQPYKTIWRLVAETGIRRGEICGLNVGDVVLVKSLLIVQRSVTKRRKLKSPKAGVRNGVVKSRRIGISPSLVEQLRPFVEGRAPDEPLFLSAEKKRLEPDNFVKRELKPILEKLGLQGGAHAFRHANATLLDSLDAPMAVRQERLGHVDEKTTMGYTHLLTKDEMDVAEKIGSALDKEFLAQDLPKFPPQTETAPETRSGAA